MAEATHTTQATGWRISKACQECRKRKIKCNGIYPCKTCQLRNTQCVYRDVIRQRKRKRQEQHEEESLVLTDHSRAEHVGSQQGSPGLSQESSRRREPSFSFNNSVSATHMTSSSCKIQLYYGSTSHFALVHEIYRDLVAHPSAQPTSGQVEEAGAGLDMFSFRRIFFGTPNDPNESGKSFHSMDTQVMFLPHELANTFLRRFLSSNYYLLSFWSPETFQRYLEQLYSPIPTTPTDRWSQGILLMALALGSLGTEHHAWADVLFERVKASCNSSFDDVVNLQTIQLSMFMAHFQNDQGRPNSAFLHVGTAARKAISAGLHKESPNEREDAVESVQERRMTFWALLFFENWICFHLGRPSSLSRRDVCILPPDDPFMLALIHISDVIARSADEMYGRHHESLLQMWRLARSITDDLRCFNSKMQCALGFGLEKPPQPGGVGVKQTMFITLYYHTILLTFRPFLIFRGRWNQDMKNLSQQPGNTSAKREIPCWLNEACSRALSAACKTIQYLYESYAINDLVRELRFHGYFLASSCLALIFDLIHGENLAATHLPWIHAAIQALSLMRKGDTIASSIISLQTILKKIDPAYEWAPIFNAENQIHGLDHAPTTTKQAQDRVVQSHDEPILNAFPNPQSLAGSLPTLSDFQGNPLPDGAHTTGSGSVASGEDLLDFTQSDMGWDFDFSTMDLETFFSINPTLDQPMY